MLCLSLIASLHRVLAPLSCAALASVAAGCAARSPASAASSPDGCREVPAAADAVELQVTIRPANGWVVVAAQMPGSPAIMFRGPVESRAVPLPPLSARPADRCSITVTPAPYVDSFHVNAVRYLPTPLEETPQ